MSCPTCGKSLQTDPDGGWCEEHGYWPEDLLREFAEEEEEDLYEGFDEDSWPGNE